MASGVKVADNVKHVFTQMKVVKHDDDPKERVRLVFFEIKEQFIEVEEGKTFREKDLSEGDAFKVLQQQLDDKKCRYILYDCHFENKESKKEELVSILWAPEEAPIKERMVYASSKHALMKETTGIKHILEVHDKTTFCTRGAFAGELTRGIVTLEGHKVSE